MDGGDLDFSFFLDKLHVVHLLIMSFQRSLVHLSGDRTLNGINQIDRCTTALEQYRLWNQARAYLVRIVFSTPMQEMD